MKCVWAGILSISCVFLTDSVFAGEPVAVSFRNDVMAVLSKAGCNAGTCHGNKSGKGGLKLSLRGDDPAGDYLTLTRNLGNRRVNPIDPEQSLLLLKPTMSVPHQGGRRFEPSDPEFRILRDWIAAGSPGPSDVEPGLTCLNVEPREVLLREPDETFQIKATATFSDGTERDGTRLAVFEPAMPIVNISPDGEVGRIDFGETTIIVRYLERKVPIRLIMIPRRDEFVWSGPEPSNFIDEQVLAKLKRLRINPSPVCDDAVFVRRIFLDLLGIPPTADEARMFVEDESTDKRERLIDRLLERPELADQWALKWSDLLRIEEKTLDRKGVRVFHAWLRNAFATNVPFDRVVREIVGGRGSTYSTPPANFYRALRDPESRAESTAQLFLGIRLQCAKCHNHPFDRWTQDDYYGWTNFFARIDYKILSNNRRDNNDKHEFDGEQLVMFTEKGSVKHPGTGEVPALRYLGEGESEPIDQHERLDSLADWIASPNNRRFADSQANRIWYQLMGTGIVDPIDDFRATNPPSHPELLELLGQEFVRSRFDVKHMLRTIANSKTYQFSSRPDETNRAETRNFARANVRRLTAEQTVDAIVHALDARAEFNGYPAGTRAGEIAGVHAVRPRDGRATLAETVLFGWGKPPRLQSCECERSDETTLGQAFQMLSGDFVQNVLEQRGNLLDRLADAKLDHDRLVEQLYWSILNRAPNSEEHVRIGNYLSESDASRASLEDIAWSLFNTKEFLFRH